MPAASTAVSVTSTASASGGVAIDVTAPAARRPGSARVSMSRVCAVGTSPTVEPGVNVAVTSTITWAVRAHVQADRAVLDRGERARSGRRPGCEVHRGRRRHRVRAVDDAEEPRTDGRVDGQLQHRGNGVGRQRSRHVDREHLAALDGRAAAAVEHPDRVDRHEPGRRDGGGNEGRRRPRHARGPGWFVGAVRAQRHERVAAGAQTVDDRAERGDGLAAPTSRRRASGSSAVGRPRPTSARAAIVPGPGWV